MKLESAAVQLKLVEPFITSYFCESNPPLVPMRRQWVLEVCLEGLFDLFFLGAHHSDRETVHRNTGSVFCGDAWNARRKVQTPT